MATTPEPGISWAEDWEHDGWIWSRLVSVSTSDDNLAYRVRESQRKDACSLYNLWEDGDRVGFCIVRSEDTLQGKCLHIWVLYHEGIGDPMEEHSEFFNDMARSIKASFITFSTTRKGWMKLAPNYGFKLRELVFQREVP